MGGPHRYPTLAGRADRRLTCPLDIRVGGPCGEYPVRCSRRSVRPLNMPARTDDAEHALIERTWGVNEKNTVYHRHRSDRDRRGRSGSSVLCLPGPGVHICGSDAQLFYFLVCASGHDSYGIECGLQSRRGCRILVSRRGATAECRRRLAELQQNTHFGALLAVERDQYEERWQA